MGGGAVRPEPIKAAMSLIPSPEFAPDVVGVGRVECPCGGLSIGPCSGPEGFSMMAQCTLCNRWLESLP